jgi:hypothetical protein
MVLYVNERFGEKPVWNWQFKNVSTSGALRRLRQRRTLIVGRISKNAPLGSFGERALHYDGRKSEIATPHEMRFAMTEGVRFGRAEGGLSSLRRKQFTN